MHESQYVCKQIGKWVLRLGREERGDNMTKREFLDIVFALAPNEANAIMDAFDEYVESNEPHWIPVTERLPKSKEEDLEYPTVLICFENEEIMLGCFYESTKEWGTGEYFDKKCNPIAWMPLPEPYKGVTT